MDPRDGVPSELDQAICNMPEQGLVIKRSLDESRDPGSRNCGPSKAVMAAGILWLILGAIVIVEALAVAFVIPFLAETLRLPPALLAAIPPLVWGVFLAYAGFETIRGTAPDPITYAFGSLLIAGVFVWYSFDLPSVLAATLLLVPAILAIIGRDQYQRWRTACGLGKRRAR